MERITSYEELLSYISKWYTEYGSIFAKEPSDHISKWYLKDFQTNLLLIQNFAHNQSKERVIE